MADAERFDAVVIGAGAGGLTVAVGLAALGRRVALVESAAVGGECTNAGCIPSKRLLHLSRDPGGRGGREVLREVRRTRDGLAARERVEIAATPGVHLIEGTARIAGPGTVAIATAAGERRIAARHVVVATGSRPRPAGVPGLDGAAVTNEDLFDITEVPGHLVVLGGGAIGVEMAVAFRRLGSAVTVVEAGPRLLPAADPEASGVLEAALAAQGVAVMTRSTAAGFDGAARVLEISSADGVTRVGEVDRVLVAVGRVPSVAGLGLEGAGAAVGPGGVAVDSWARAAPGVWAVGDVTAAAHQTHAANAQGRRAVQRIVAPWLPLGRRPVVPTAVFSDPEVAWIGPGDAELARRLDLRATMRIRIDLRDTDRGLTDGVEHGFVAVRAMRVTGRILSATVVGPAASELIAVLAVAMRARMSLYGVHRTVFPYPTFAGTIGAVADEFVRRTLPRLHREGAAYLCHRIPSGRRT